MSASFAIPLTSRARHLLELEEQASSEEALEAPATVVSNAMRTAVSEALHRGETHYTDRPGLLALRTAIADGLTRRFGIPIDAKADATVTCGVTEARFVALQQLLAPGAVIAAPVHRERLEGAAVLRRAHLATDVVADADLLYVASSKPESDCRAALDAAAADAAVLYEIDEEANNFHPGQLEGFASRTSTIGSLGDESWRIGYLISPTSASPGMRDFKQALTICSTNLSQWAVLAALEAGEITL